MARVLCIHSQPIMLEGLKTVLEAFGHVVEIRLRKRDEIFEVASVDTDVAVCPGKYADLAKQLVDEGRCKSVIMSSSWDDRRKSCGSVPMNCTGQELDEELRYAWSGVERTFDAGIGEMLKLDAEIRRRDGETHN